MEDLKKLAIQNLKYLEANHEFFLENLTVLSDMIFDRYSIEQTVEKRNPILIQSYENTLPEISNLEKRLKEEINSYEARLKELEDDSMPIDAQSSERSEQG